MYNEKYLNEKLLEAIDYVNLVIGKKEYYTFNDVFILLKSFNFTKEIYLEDINDYLPSSLPLVESISSFSKGYISDYDIYKIYAINYGSSFAIIVVSSKDGNIVSDYYGDLFNDFTMKIYYCLSIMCKENPYCCN
ncbi:MAG: hypothetical protein ACI35W_00330 [Anaeroplasmataceae bacterium]